MKLLYNLIQNATNYLKKFSLFFASDRKDISQDIKKQNTEPM